MALRAVVAARRRAKALLELARRVDVGLEEVAGVAEVVRVTEVVGRKAVEAGVRHGRLDTLTILCGIRNPRGIRAVTG